MLAIYTRLSNDKEESTSIANQQREGVDFAKRNNLNYKIYNEGEGVSGRKELEQRPVLFQLTKDITEGTISHVWFRHQNRLERNSLTFQLFAKTVKKANTKVYFADKEEDFNDPTSMLNMGIMSLLGAYQAELVGIQVKKTNRDNASEGKVVGNIPFGYTKDKFKRLIPCPTDSAIVKQLFEDYLNGKGTTTLAQELTQREIPTRSKNTFKWVDSTILYILKNELYIGKRIYGGKVYENIDPIIEKDLFNKVQIRLKKGSKKGKNSYQYLLNDLLHCGCCPEPFLGRSYTYRGYFYYKCLSQRYPERRCANRSVKMEDLDKLIWDSLFENSRLFDEVKKSFKEDDNEKKKQKIRLEIEMLTKNLNKLDSKKDKVHEMVENDIMTIKKAKERILALDNEAIIIKDEIDKKQSQIKMLHNQRALYEDIEKDFDRIFGKAFEGLGPLFDDLPNEEPSKEDIELFNRTFKNIDLSLTVNDLNKSLITSIGIEEKQELLKKYIQGITVTYLDKSNKFKIEVKFNLPIKNKVLYLIHNLGRTPRKKLTV